LNHAWIYPFLLIFIHVILRLLADALLEYIPAAMRVAVAYRLLFMAGPGAALPCPYCRELLGFYDHGQPRVPQSGWPVLRYGRAELEVKKRADGAPADVTLEEWALRHRFTQPGTHLPLGSYVYAEQVPFAEFVP
jgi:hypothetical protein